MQARDDEKTTRERNTNLLLAFSSALGRSRVGATLDKQRVVATLGSVLGAPGVGPRSLQPLHDLLIHELKADPADAAGVSLFIKGCESRYSVTTELPREVEALSADERAAASTRFAARTADAGRSGAFQRSAAPPAPPAAKGERHGGERRGPAADQDLRPNPVAAGIAFAVIAVITFVVAIPMGVGANEAGWSVGAMWLIRHGLLLLGGIALLAALATSIPRALASVFGGFGRAAVLGLVGGVGMGLLAHLIAPSVRDESFVLGVVVLASIAHAAVERFAFFVVQRGLGEPSSKGAAGIVIAMQVAYVFTFAIVLGGSAGQMAIWMVYAAFTAAGPAALLNRNGSFWPGFAWHVGFMLANIGMS